MNALIYCENGNLTIRKPNGLEWQHEQVDKPELGFKYDLDNGVSLSVAYFDAEMKAGQEDGLVFELRVDIF